MKAERLWLQKQCVLLARNIGGSPLDWTHIPLNQLGGWVQTANELNGKQSKDQPKKLPINLAGEKARELFELPGNG